MIERRQSLDPTLCFATEAAKKSDRTKTAHARQQAAAAAAANGTDRHAMYSSTNRQSNDADDVGRSVGRYDDTAAGSSHPSRESPHMHGVEETAMAVNDCATDAKVR